MVIVYIGLLSIYETKRWDMLLVLRCISAGTK